MFAATHLQNCFHFAKLKLCHRETITPHSPAPALGNLSSTFSLYKFHSFKNSY